MIHLRYWDPASGIERYGPGHSFLIRLSFLIILNMALRANCFFENVVKQVRNLVFGVSWRAGHVGVEAYTYTYIHCARAYIIAHSHCSAFPTARLPTARLWLLGIIAWHPTARLWLWLPTACSALASNCMLGIIAWHHF